MRFDTIMIAANGLSQREMRWALMTLTTIVLLFVIFAVGLFLVRMMRHKRQRLERKRSDPTPYVDAWSMHKVPSDTDPPESESPDDEERPTS